MPKTKIDVNPIELEKLLHQYLIELLDENNTNALSFTEPVLIENDEENDVKLYISQLFRNNDNVENQSDTRMYFIYYDGCSCPHLIESPENRYNVIPVSRSSIQHLWLVYQATQTN